MKKSSPGLAHPVFAADAFWESVVLHLEQPPTATLTAVALLTEVHRRVTAALSHSGRWEVPGDVATVNPYTLADRMIASYFDLQRAVELAVDWAFRSAGATPGNLLQRFAGYYRRTAYNNVEELIPAFPAKVKSVSSFDELSGLEQRTILGALAGYTPLGRALASRASHRDEVRKLLADKRVAKVRAARGPKSGAQAVVALYSGISEATWRFRLRQSQAVVRPR